MFYLCEDDVYTIVISSKSNQNDTATVTVTASDEFNGSTSKTFNVTILSANNDIVFSESANKTFEDIGANSDELKGKSVLSMMQTFYPDQAAQLETTDYGLALVEVYNEHGKFQYSTDDGQTWNDITGISEQHAILLSASDSQTRIRFFNENKNFRLTPSYLKYVVWDQTYGSNGQTDVNIYGTDHPATVKDASGEISFVVYNSIDDIVVMTIPVMGDWGQFLFFMVLMCIGMAVIRCRTKCAFGKANSQ